MSWMLPAALPQPFLSLRTQKYTQRSHDTKWGLVLKAYLFLDFVPEDFRFLNPRMQRFICCLVLEMKERKKQSMEAMEFFTIKCFRESLCCWGTNQTKPNQTEFSTESQWLSFLHIGFLLWQDTSREIYPLHTISSAQCSSVNSRHRVVQQTLQLTHLV